MTPLVVALCCLVTCRWWFLVSRDKVPFGQLRERLEDASSKSRAAAWIMDGVECPFCSSIWWGLAAAGVAWHGTPVDGSWWWWVPSVALVASLVTALIVWAVAVMERYVDG